jgi:LPXTG-site transpeptidase (sortase) family protein
MKLPKKLFGSASKLMFVLAGIVLVVGLLVGLRQHHDNVVAAKQASNNSSAPSTTRPRASAFASHKVAADLARYIFIPKLNVVAMVGSVGLTKTGAIGTPGNVFMTAWYNGSSKPGQSGATVIDGHVSSWTTNGVFYNLHKLLPGDNIKIERGDGTMFTYIVNKVQYYPSNNVDMAGVLAPVDPAKPALTLITCAGAVIKGTNEFSERIVVYSEQISNTL